MCYHLRVTPFSYKFFTRSTRCVIGAPSLWSALAASSDDADSSSDDSDDDDGCSASVSRRVSTALGGTSVPHSSTHRLQRLTICVTTAQYAFLRQQAAKQAASVSFLVRQLLFRACRPKREERHDHAR